jgi:AraC family transcriptional regulator
MLIARSELSITDIALQFGFSDSAVFSRSFKKHYKMKPSEFRQKYSNNCKDFSFEPFYTKRVDSRINAVTAEVETLEIAAFPVLYTRKIGAYKKLYDYADTFAKAISDLFTFGMSRNLIDEEVKVLFAYHTYPDFSEEERQRTSFCVSITESVFVDEESEIGCMEIPSGNYAVGHFEIFHEEYADAWNYLYGEWLPQSGYLPRNSFPFEVYLNKPDEHPEKKHIVDIYMPIVPLS